ncbi:MAG: hypothetical protein AAFX09_11595 [Pseudomonadota bacterium]
MFGASKVSERRQEEYRLAATATDHALAALAAGDKEKARTELAAVPRKVDFAEIGWRVALVNALINLAFEKRRQGVQGLVSVCSRLDETSLSRDDKGYLRLFALYRAIEVSKNGKAPRELRELVDDFRFDHTLVTASLREGFPLKRTEGAAPPLPPPPKSAPPTAGDTDPFKS